MEAAAVIGLVSAIFNFVEFGNKVVDRLNDFKQSINEVPRTFRNFNDQLPLLIDTLKRTRIQADAGHVAEATAKALIPVVDGCLERVERLEGILVKAIPSKNDSTLSRRIKALSSLAHDRTVQQIISELESYVNLLIYQQATSCSDLSGRLVLRGASQPLELNTEVKREPYFKFEQDENFTGREDIIKEIDVRLMGRQHRVALAGIGGVG
jgi:N-terminal domain on NACHT_NTPase and P-loop NTPases